MKSVLRVFLVAVAILAVQGCHEVNPLEPDDHPLTIRPATAAAPVPAARRTSAKGSSQTAPAVPVRR